MESGREEYILPENVLLPHFDLSLSYIMLLLLFLIQFICVQSEFRIRDGCPCKRGEGSWIVFIRNCEDSISTSRIDQITEALTPPTTGQPTPCSTPPPCIDPPCPPSPPCPSPTPSCPPPEPCVNPPCSTPSTCTPPSPPPCPPPQQCIEPPCPPAPPSCPPPTRPPVPQNTSVNIPPAPPLPPPSWKPPKCPPPCPPCPSPTVPKPKPTKPTLIAPSLDEILKVTLRRTNFTLRPNWYEDDLQGCFTKDKLGRSRNSQKCPTQCLQKKLQLRHLSYQDTNCLFDQPKRPTIFGPKISRRKVNDLGSKYKPNETQLCTGVIISSLHILTSAHCVFTRSN